MIPILRAPRSLQVGAALSLLLTSSCATLAAAEANRRVPAAVANGVLTPARAPAEKFGASPARTCPVGGVYGEVEGTLAAAVRDRGAVEVPADGRLCAVAEAMLAWPSDEVPVHVRAFLGRYFGLAGGAPELVLVTLESDDPRLIGSTLAETIQRYGARVTSPRYGLAAVLVSGRRGGDKAIQDASTAKSRVIVALYSDALQVDPLPRRLELGQKATLSGALSGDLENPKVLVSDAQGHLATVTQPPGRAFKAELACDARPGRIVVEVRGEEMGNERVIGAFTVACATDLALSVPVAAPAPWPADPAVQEKKMMELIDAERAGAGLPALTWFEPLGAIARDITGSIRDGAKKGAVVVPVNIAKRLAEADVQAPVVLQNPSAAYSGEVAFDRLMNSPSARADIMSTEVSHAGLGVAIGTDANGKPAVYLTELFIKLQPPPDVGAARRVIREAIDKKRVAERLGALTSDPILDKLASDYAAVVAAAGGPPPKARTEEFERALKKGYRDVVLLRDARIDLSDFAEDPNALAKGKLVGLGGALGRHPRLGKNTLFVVLIIANKLPGAK
jgi:uncharacterized protein YkwD